MAKSGPKLTQEKPSKLPNLDIRVRPKDSKIKFSFSYFKEISNFQIGGCNSTWFVSLIERLTILSEKESSFFLEGNRGGKSLRWHEINWNAKNIPLERSVCTWVPEQYLNNNRDYPFFQFSISTGTGRVIGFFNIDYTVFYIVLLDPHHNLQPSKDFKYKVTSTRQIPTEYDQLLKEYDCICDEVKKCVADKPCKAKEAKQIAQLYNIVYARLDDDLLELYEQQIESGKSMHDILENGLFNLL